MKKTLFALALLTVVAAAPSWAKDLQGMYGLGYFRPEAPVGGRVWFTDKLGADLGVGFTAWNSDNPGSPKPGEGAVSFTVDLGLPFVLHNTDNTVFFVRPGFTFNSTPNPTTLDADNSATQFWVSGSFGAEHFFSDRFSVQVAHGLVFKSVNPGDSFTEITTEDFGVSSIGFHYYFGGK